MLRVARLPHSQTGALNLLINKRWQKTTATSGTGTTAAAKTTTDAPKTEYTTTNTASPIKPPATSTKPSLNVPIDRTTTTNKVSSSSIPHYTPKAGPPPTFSAPSSGKTGGGGGRTTVKALIYGVTLGLAATVVYAEYENGPFRHQLESTIPYSSTVFTSIDQFIDPIFGRQKSLTTEVPETVPDLAFVKEKASDVEKPKKVVEQTKQTVNTVLEKLPEKTKIQKTGAQVKDAIDHAADQVKGAVNNVRDALPDTTTLKKKITHAKEQVEESAHAVKETIKDALPSTKDQLGKPSEKVADPVFLEEAGKVLALTQEKYKQLEDEIAKLYSPLSKQIDDAVKAAREHVSHMKTIIDNPTVSTSDHETWKQAEHLQEQAKHAYEKVTEAVREWKNKLEEFITVSSGEMHPHQKKLDEKFQELQKQYTTSNFVKNFRTYIDEATKSFQKEIETMFPSLAGKNPSQLTQEDLQALLLHAHRRVVKLQHDIARLRINESDSVKAAVDVARAELDRLVEQRAQERVANTTEQLTEELKLYEKNLRQQFDEQLRHEIVLQHQALTQYLADVLSRQYQEWANEYERQLENESIKININLQNQLRSTLDRLYAIEQAIEANYDSQQRGRQAQQLWIQAQNILNQIVQGTTTENDLDIVSKIVPNERFVQVLVNELRSDDIPSTNEKVLRERFAHVNKLCRRLALIDNEHNSLWNYFLSYLQSLLIVRQRDDSILVDDAVDLNQLNTFTILNYVQSYLDQNQWYNALRLMQLLTGEPRNVAESWINDARNYLAKKQTSELLEAYSNSIGLGTLPRTA
ncbi:unnamed protein product [Rotaria magnacalcarata]|uniref:MICOS complex subunit MIC60 n=2 Tax=Rotaria magnacalcarata TaxID=392030 RepID=A0A819N3B3_9BILA|nr:unnamed protein product [Rotaria magnacalcarata]CAF3988271.1 unnamed protein product [Rotaria magnacalcarata]